MSELFKHIEKEIPITVTTSIGSLIAGLDQTDAKNVIVALDLAQADADFTIDVIKTIFKSLTVDLDKDEMKTLESELKQIRKASYE